MESILGQYLQQPLGGLRLLREGSLSKDRVEFDRTGQMKSLSGKRGKKVEDKRSL
jgi:hypothetical protein